MDKINYELYLENFLDDKLTPSERKWLEKELNGNDKLKAELELRRDVNHSLADSDLLHFTAELENVYEEYAGQSSPRPFLAGLSKKKLAAIGSAAAMLVVAVLIYLTNFKPLDKQELYATYFEPYEATIYRSSAENMDNVLREAMQHYENKNYARALIGFEKVLTTDSLNVPTNFYSGISYMEIEKYSKANHSFKVVIDQNNSLFMEQAEWYLGFCYLMTDKTDKAKEQFQSIAKSDSFYKKKAAKVLRQIK